MLNRGQTLQRRYLVQHALGRGGMGSVYLAVDKETGRSVAVKVLLAESDAAVRQFEVEGRILRELEHPNLPKVHGLFREFDVNYLVMDFIPGKALDDVLQAEGKHLDEGRVLSWARQLCDVLEYMHGHKPPVIFRDLKPSNVMVIEGDRIKLIDFGIAKIVEQDANKTETQTVARGVGSRGFAAPEQYGGGTDAQSDIYSLGATLYCLLTRQIPPDSVDVATGRGARPNLRGARPDLSDAMVKAVEAMMTVDRSKRPHDIAKVRELLSEAKRGPSQKQRIEEVPTVRRGSPSGKTDTGSMGLERETGKIPPAPRGGESGSITGPHPEKPPSVAKTQKSPPRRIDIKEKPWVGPLTIVFVVLAIIGGVVALATLHFTKPSEGSDASPAARRSAAAVAASPAAAASSAASGAPATASAAPSRAPSPTSSGPRVVIATPAGPRVTIAAPSATPTPSPTPASTPTPAPKPSEAPSAAPSAAADDDRELPVAKRPTALRGWRISPGDSVGMVKLGAPAEAISPYAMAGEIGGEKALVFRRLGLAVAHADGKISHIYMAPIPGAKRNRLFRTERGTGIGDVAQNVIDEFGPPEQTVPRKGGVDWRYPRRGISFRLRGEWIVEIEVFPLEQ